MHNLEAAEILLQQAYDGNMPDVNLVQAVDAVGSMALHIVFDSMLASLSYSVRETPQGQLAQVMMVVAKMRGSEINSDHDQLFFERRYGLNNEI